MIKDKQVSEKLLLVSIIISMLFWGLSWPSAKSLTQFCSPFNFGVYRYIVVLATMLPILFFLKTSFKIKREGIAHLLASGILLASYSYFFYMGLKNGSAGAGGVLVTTLNPIMAYAWGMVLQRRKPSRNESIGLLLGLIAGFILLKIWNSFHILLESGNLYFLLSAFSWAVMSKFTSKANSYGSPLGFVFWQYAITLLCLTPFIQIAEAKMVFQIPDLRFWFNLFFTSAIVTSLATTIYFYATTRLGAEKASSFIFMVPLAAAVSSWIFLGETILPHTIIGGLIGILAVYTINRK